MIYEAAARKTPTILYEEEVLFPAPPAEPPAWRGFLRTVGRFLALSLLSVVLLGCHDHSALEKQLAELKADIQQLKMVHANSNVQMEDIENRVLLLHDQVDSNRLLLTRNDSVGGAPPPMPIVKLSPTTAPTPVAAPAPVPAPQPAMSPPRQPETPGVIELHTIDEHGQVTTTARPTPGTKTSAPPAHVASSSRKKFDSRPVMLYRQAMDLLKQKKHDTAIAAFEDFLIQYPGHDYADNALYWVGEAYYDRQLYHKALARFEQVVVQYPGGNKVPDAMLKAAFCYRQMGLKDRSDRLLDKLIRTFPGTNAARLARKNLSKAN